MLGVATLLRRISYRLLLGSVLLIPIIAVLTLGFLVFAGIVAVAIVLPFAIVFRAWELFLYYGKKDLRESGSAKKIGFNGQDVLVLIALALVGYFEMKGLHTYNIIFTHAPEFLEAFFGGILYIIEGR